jgi:hypothetical protein
METDIGKYIMLRDFFLGFIKIHIPPHAGQGPVYGVVKKTHAPCLAGSMNWRRVSVSY